MVQDPLTLKKRQVDSARTATRKKSETKSHLGLKKLFLGDGNRWRFVYHIHYF